MSNDLISRKAQIEAVNAIKNWIPKNPCGKEQIIEKKVATNLLVIMLMDIEDAPVDYDIDSVFEEIHNVFHEELDIILDTIFV